MGSQPMNEVKFWIAVGLGSGLSPKAPGTTGTLGVLPLLILDVGTHQLSLGLLTVILCVLSIWYSRRGAETR